jgi:hypothetical protein
MYCLYTSGAVVSILDSHRRDPGSIPCNVTFCPNLEIVTLVWLLLSVILEWVDFRMMCLVVHREDLAATHKRPLGIL